MPKIKPLNLILLILVVFGAISLYAYSSGSFFSNISNYSDQQNTSDNFINNAFNTQKGALTTDYVGAKVPIDDIAQGCLGGVDCIPSIDSPIFESAEQGDSWLNDSDIIFGVNYKGQARAYAQRIMNWHEIVNDTIQDDPIAVTFCPLCGTAVSFERKVNGEVVEFGVSGKLYNSDLIMYDRTEGNYWQQATGEAIVGPAARRDEFLTPVSTITTTWGKWKARFPETQVLSRETGFVRDYSAYPYGTYESDSDLYFSVQNQDDRFHPKDVKYGILVDEQAKAYFLEDLQDNPSFEDTINGQTVVVSYDSTVDNVTFINKETNEEYVPLRGFWFAWVAFYPDTLVYGIE